MSCSTSDDSVYVPNLSFSRLKKLASPPHPRTWFPNPFRLSFRLKTIDQTLTLFLFVFSMEKWKKVKMVGWSSSARTGSIADGLASGSKSIGRLMLRYLGILTFLVLRTLVFDRLFGVAVLSLGAQRIRQELLFGSFLGECTSRRCTVTVLSLYWTNRRLVILYFHVSRWHTRRRHGHRWLTHARFVRRYAHVSHRFANYLANSLEERISKVRCAEKQNNKIQAYRRKFR